MMDMKGVAKLLMGDALQMVAKVHDLHKRSGEEIPDYCEVKIFRNNKTEVIKIEVDCGDLQRVQ
jgi:hypothetical protein